MGTDAMRQNIWRLTLDRYAFQRVIPDTKCQYNYINIQVSTH
jgi:hypothetical protein